MESPEAPARQEEPHPVLGLDIGTVRIGIAISDPLQLIAGAHRVLPCKSREADIDEIERLVHHHEIQTVVVGLPRTLRGKDSASTELARDYAKRLEERLPECRVELWDERLSTKQAEAVLVQASVRRKKRKEHVDKIAAALILQSYLDSRRSA